MKSQLLVDAQTNHGEMFSSLNISWHQRLQRKRQKTGEPVMMTGSMLSNNPVSCQDRERSACRGADSLLTRVGIVMSPIYPSSFSKRKRLIISSGSLFSDLDTASDLSSAVYAGARFTSPPSPRVLPLPPLHWRMGTNIHCEPPNCAEMTNTIKGLLRI